jgi:hypothetical protein
MTSPGASIPRRERRETPGPEEPAGVRLLTRESLWGQVRGLLGCFGIGRRVQPVQLVQPI